MNFKGIEIVKYLVVTRNNGEEIAWIKSNDGECIRNLLLEITENDYEVVQMFFDWLRLKSNNSFVFREGVIELVEI